LTIKFEAKQCIDIKVICKVNQTQKLKNFQHIPRIGMYAHLTFCNMLRVSIAIGGKFNGPQLQALRNLVKLDMIGLGKSK
jgi:hypothetical protein